MPWTAALLSLLLSQGRGDVLLEDFEGPDYGKWTVAGSAFGDGPARGTLPNQMPVSGFRGKGLVNSYVGGDASTGCLTSPSFTISRRYLCFLIGGGKNAEKLCLNLVVDGKIVRSATGPNDRPGGSEALRPASWDVSELQGRWATLEIVDRATGGWGHINVDHLVLSDRPPPPMLMHVERTLKIEKRFLCLPIQNGAPMRAIKIHLPGLEPIRNEIELAEGEPDWWTAFDVSAWKGMEIRLEADDLQSSVDLLARVRQSDQPIGKEPAYREARRGQFHFSPRRGWNNDPVGLVYFRGEYHLFFQHNPFGWPWGNMHWGHAVSKDLVHWTELPEALYPDASGTMFSGSAVVVDGKLALFYTSAGEKFTQGLAWSEDGRTFAKFPQNPVVPQITHGNRDPKVFWHDATKSWVMSLYVEEAGEQRIHFLTSEDLTHWTFASEISGFYECPDLFPVALDGDPAQTKWILAAASSEYMVGSFDGRTFKPETPKLAGHRGAGFYAAQTFSDIPKEDGRRIQIGWFQTPTPGMPFNQSMTVPLELRLRSTKEGPRLTWAPVRELAELRLGSQAIPRQTLTPTSPDPLAKLRGELIELRLEGTPSADAVIELNLRGLAVAYSASSQELTVNGHRAAAPLVDGKLALTILVDRQGSEVFASEGLAYVPMPFLPDPKNRRMSLEVNSGGFKVDLLEIHELKSAWKR